MKITMDFIINRTEYNGHRHIPNQVHSDLQIRALLLELYFFRMKNS